MSWASSRETTRGEDEAYSLMGIFGVSIPPLYGEGQRRAFRRLQVEIMHSTHDHTLFAWSEDIISGDMFAPRVSSFRYGSSLMRMDHTEFIDSFEIKSPKLDYRLTNLGVHIQLPLCPVPHIVIITLPSWHAKPKTLQSPKYLAICLHSSGSNNLQIFNRVTFDNRSVCQFAKISVAAMETALTWISPRIQSEISGRKLRNNALDGLNTIEIDFGPTLKAQTNIPTIGQRIGEIRTLTFPREQLQNFHNPVFLFDGLYLVLGMFGGRLWFCVGQLPDSIVNDSQAFKHLDECYSFPSDLFGIQIHLRMQDKT